MSSRTFFAVNQNEQKTTVVGFKNEGGCDGLVSKRNSAMEACPNFFIATKTDNVFVTKRLRC
jgi:hypothetical protein